MTLHPTIQTQPPPLDATPSWVADPEVIRMAGSMRPEDIADRVNRITTTLQKILRTVKPIPHGGINE